MFRFLIALALVFPVTAQADEVVTAEDINPALIGGEVADPKDWPASPWVGNCSSTLIGPRVLLTAAHCVSNGGTKSFTIGATRYQGACAHHPDYRRNSTADWALCYLTTAVEGVPFEQVAKPAEIACAVGKKFLWTGYGCTRWGGRLDGKFRTGEVSTTKCPRGTDYDTVTKGSVALCSGDSGGGGYLKFEDGRRLLVGVNSRSNTTDTSYVSSTYTETFHSWALGWAKSKDVEICGLTPGATGCRGAPDPGPQPDPQPQPECLGELATAVDLSGKGRAALLALEQCLKGK